jgi:hypothetical protein
MWKTGPRTGAAAEPMLKTNFRRMRTTGGKHPTPTPGRVALALTNGRPGLPYDVLHAH